MVVSPSAVSEKWQSRGSWVESSRSWRSLGGRGRGRGEGRNRELHLDVNWVILHWNTGNMVHTHTHTHARTHRTLLGGDSEVLLDEVAGDGQGPEGDQGDRGHKGDDPDG